MSPAAPASSPVSGGYRAIDITDKEPAVKPSLASDVAGTNVEVGPFVKEGHMGEVRETPEVTPCLNLLRCGVLIEPVFVFVLLSMGAILSSAGSCEICQGTC